MLDPVHLAELGLAHQRTSGFFFSATFCLLECRAFSNNPVRVYYIKTGCRCLLSYILKKEVKQEILRCKSSNGDF